MTMDCRIINADCMNAMRELIAQDIQVDSIVTDPPYEINFMNKDFDKTGIAHNIEMWKLCLQILKPGGHIVAFGLPRTYHRMACAIEDAGFEIRDCIRFMGQLHYPSWVQGQGFPKSCDISKQIDKMSGAEREVIGKYELPDVSDGIRKKGWHCTNTTEEGMFGVSGQSLITAPATEAAKQWQGWHSALKPAWEPIVLARKPLSEKTIAANVLKHGTGAINVDGCRVTVSEDDPNRRTGEQTFYEEPDHLFKHSGKKRGDFSPQGRFPANIIHDSSEEVESEFAKYGEKKTGVFKSRKTNGFWESDEISQKVSGCKGGDTGTASRFFYCAKASKKDRNGSKHPTVKPIALMRYLCRLITPPGGIILDPFAGSGTTGQAAIEEGFKYILIEKEAEYLSDINARLQEIMLKETT
jgi:DNA modification methylase